MKKIVKTDAAPAAIGAYSQAVISHPFLFISGQIGISPDTGKLVDGGVEAQVRQALCNLEAILTAGGAHSGAVVKTTIFLTDIDDFPIVNKSYLSVFKEDPPSRSTVQVAALPLGAAVEIEAIAAVD
ncbi:MAG: reactive intermediate/imine deaminase [Deltaproteobacteria bacterium]|nr:MAG: reactive intermediate/imine deaminase [Deltaproteobacteria bacterium]